MRGGDQLLCGTDGVLSPAIGWIRSCERRWLRGELIAGAAAAAAETSMRPWRRRWPPEEAAVQDCDEPALGWPVVLRCQPAC
jgi:hypothetical protein